MLLKLERSQRDAGLLGKTVMFCLDARVEFTPPERNSVNRYKLGGLTIYNSQAQQSAAEAGALAAARAKGQKVDIDSFDGFMSSAGSKLGHGLKAAALGAISAMRLQITVGSLERGEHVECKSMDELLGAEDAIMTACENLRVYLDTAATFDGRTVVYEFNTDGAQVVAQSAAPSEVLAAASPVAIPALESPASGGTVHSQAYQQPQEQTYEPAYAGGYGEAAAEYEPSFFEDPVYAVSKWWKEEDPFTRWTSASVLAFLALMLLYLLIR